VTRGESLTARLAPVTLVVGKGGVGKTTVAAAVANEFSGKGQRTLVVTTDPAGTLLSAFSQRITLTPLPVPLRETLAIWAVDTQRVRDDFLAAWRDSIALILDRGTYLDSEDVRGLVDATLPGADEIFALLAIGDVLGRTGDDAYARIIIDTAPTGHTLRLLNLPRSFAAVVRLLDAMQEKHRFMVRALTHRYRADSADALIAELRQRVETLERTLTDPTKTAAILVARPEPVVIAESTRYLDALAESRIGVTAILVNTWRDTPSERAAIAPLEGRDLHVFVAPLLESNVIDTLLDSVHHLKPESKEKPKKKSASLGSPAANDPIPWNSVHSVSSVSSVSNVTRPNVAQTLGANVARPLTIIAGKGGVGKTTVACAIAIAVADTGRQTLLVSTDPAPSVGDALALPIGDDETAVKGVANLTARQMDATAAFATLRDQYQERIDEVFANITARGMDLAHDRQILRDLLALAPPGVDELYALTVLGSTMDDGRFACIVVDPAPTGHLLRLLDMPALAVAWAHQLMRLMLKYKEVVGLGEAAQDLLTFAKRTRSLEERLRDPARATALVVSLDETLVRGESERLVGALRERGVPVGAIVWNRAAGSTPPLPTNASILQLFAPLSSPAPIGVDAIRKWRSSWATVGR
jgi:arsenite/tail-anchored protein-transporting ATPase